MLRIGAISGDKAGMDEAAIDGENLAVDVAGLV
jgi:hypothetical protein